MDGKINQKIQENPIINWLECLDQFDDEALLREYEAAEREVLDFQRTNPGELEEPDAGFDELMKRIKKENIQPYMAGLADEIGRVGQTGRKIIHARGVLRRLVIAAILGVMLVMGGISTYGGRGFRWWEREFKENRSRINWNNAEYKQNNVMLDDAYNEIETVLNIPAMKIGYMPDGMNFEGKILNEPYARATLRFSYNGKIVTFIQQKRDVESSISLSADTRRRVEVSNRWINQRILVGENVLEDGSIEYLSVFSIRDAMYTLYGVVEKEYFLEMIESLYSFN